MAPDCGGAPRLEVWLACVCQCLEVAEPHFWFWGPRVCIAVTISVVGLVSQLFAPQAVAQDPWRFWRRWQAHVPSQGLKVGQGVSQKHLVPPCPGGQGTAGGVQPGHAESQGILSLRGDLAHLGDRQGICTCDSVSSGCQQDPFLSAQGSGVSGWHLQLPLASPPKFHRRSLGSLLGSLVWSSTPAGHSGTPASSPLSLAVRSLAGGVCTVTRMGLDPSRLPLQLQGLSGGW